MQHQHEICSPSWHMYLTWFVQQACSTTAALLFLSRWGPSQNNSQLQAQEVYPGNCNKTRDNWTRFMSNSQFASTYSKGQNQDCTQTFCQCWKCKMRATWGADQKHRKQVTVIFILPRTQNPKQLKYFNLAEVSFCDFRISVPNKIKARGWPPSRTEQVLVHLALIWSPEIVCCWLCKKFPLTPSRVWTPHLIDTRCPWDCSGNSVRETQGKSKKQSDHKKHQAT